MCCTINYKCERYYHYTVCVCTHVYMTLYLCTHGTAAAVRYLCTTSNSICTKNYLI